MLDQRATGLLAPALQFAARRCIQIGLSANQVTVLGFAVGLAAAYFISQSQFGWGLIFILLSRLCDGVDGAIARLTKPSDFGGFLDICFDFLFYASIPLAFAWASPTQNALAATVLLASFMGTATSFLAFAALAAKRNLQSAAFPNKSFYFLGGLTGATETLLFFIAMCLFSQWFAPLAYVFAGLCVITCAMRIYWGWQQLR